MSQPGRQNDRPPTRGQPCKHRNEFHINSPNRSTCRTCFQLFYLAKIMGTSVQMIDQTYGHLLPDSEEYLRGLLDNYDSATVASGGS